MLIFASSELPPSAPGKPRALLRRIWLSFLIIAGVLYGAFYISHAYEYFTADGQAKIEEDRRHWGSFFGSMRNRVETQLDQLKTVNSDALVNVYFHTMKTTNCDWFFQCTSIYHQERLGYKGPRTVVPASDAQLFYHPGWIIHIPTPRTIRGTPHGLVETAKAIRQAGGWAVAMFISCTAIWMVLVLWALNSKPYQQGPAGVLAVYLMVIATPVAISLMVSVIQWSAELALEKVGSGLGLLVEVFAHSTALALIVGIPHVLKSPREVREAAEMLKHVS